MLKVYKIPFSRNDFSILLILPRHINLNFSKKIISKVQTNPT
jgi:hypothetical protein